MADRNIDDPEFVQGQLDALRAIIYALARLTANRDEFLADALRGIDNARTVISGTPASDRWLEGLDDEEQWLHNAVG